jgi:hypothetical protein
MYTKFVIFVAVSALLVTAIYSSAFIAFAAQTKCTILKNGDSICVSGDKKTTSYCIHDPKTLRVVKCLTLGEAAAIEEVLNNTKVPKTDVLTDDSLLNADNNNTKVPKSDILKDNNILEDNNNNDNNTSNDNVKPPKAPKVPEDLGGLINNGG